jgi:uncharacterized membrane protein YphA (DoxX/SURF4 family)
MQTSNPLTMLFSNKVFVFALRIFLGVIFVYSSADKVLEPDRFAIAIRGYQILPLGLTNLAALVIAWGELLSGIMLIFGVFTRKAAAAVLILLLVFTVAIVTTMVRGVVVDCGCFANEGGSQTGFHLVLRNLFLLATALMVMRFDRDFFGLTKFLGQRRRGVQ